MQIQGAKARGLRSRLTEHGLHAVNQRGLLRDSGTGVRSKSCRGPLSAETGGLVRGPSSCN